MNQGICKCSLQSSAPTATILIRIVVGLVFFVEGVQKFLYLDTLGVGALPRSGSRTPK